MPKFDPTVTISRGSTSINLGSDVTDDGYILKQGVTGLGIAPVEHELSSIPSGHGALLRHTRLTERELFFPVFVYGDSYEQVDKRRDALFSLVDPVKGPVRVSVQSRTRNSDVRWVDAVYSEGLDGDYGTDFGGCYQHIGLTLKVPSAFWSADPVSRLFQIKPGVKPFISKSSEFFPVILSSSSVAGVFAIRVDGDKPVWPIFTVTGPGSDLTIEANGKRIKYEGDIKVGRRITFDTAAGDVYDKNNPNGELWNRVSLDTDFFQLEPGVNQVKVTFTGATEASLLELTYKPQYLTGY
ncbi:phage distal tail protein [Rothia koreensis]|uniref:phage distal tail protein n=1 Tax=Rothia koreensis TaxID=592378 RepID=UPI003FCD950D